MNKLRTIALAGAAMLIATAAGAGINDAPSQQLQDQFQTQRSGAARDIQVAQLFGESDEEQKARLQHEQNQDSSIHELNNRVGDLEATVTRLTGQIEQLDHRLAEANARMERMQKDFDYKLCTMTAQQMGASTDPNDPNALPCAGGSSQQQGAPQQQAAPSAPRAFTPPPNESYQPNDGYQPSVTVNVPPPSTPMPQANGGPVHLAPPPGVLGTLPANAPPPRRQQQDGIQTGMLPSVDMPSQYQAALKLLAQAQYDEARAQFRSFADSYPDDPQAPQAVYWIANISYGQKDYANASRGFAEELKKYPASAAAPESMLKLGKSLLAMNQKKEGCTFLGALPAKYPAAAKNVTAEALAARKGAGCR